MPINTLVDDFRNLLRSWAGVTDPPRSNWGTTLSVPGGKVGFGGASASSISVSSSSGSSKAAEGA